MSIESLVVGALLVVGEPAARSAFDGLASELACESAAWTLGTAPPWLARAFDVVVVCVSAGADGLERLMALRAQRPEAPTLVLLSEHSEPQLLRAAAESADDFVLWPSRGPELEERLRRLARTRDPRGVKATAKRLNRQIALAELVGEDRRFRELVDTLPRFAESDSTLLILGETGTGKELCARAIHQLSGRSEAPFVVVDCGALPDSLLENELFGHARGAYTDARAEQRGLVALAEGGTLFLDEVDALSPAGQAKLLRLLEERSYRPLGSDRSVRADVRLLAATNADLPALIAERKFRRDLYHRLNVLSFEIPPLRERREDVPLLAAYFARALSRSSDRNEISLGAAALAKLRGYAWPGNVRELANVVRRALFRLRPGELDIQPSYLDVPASTVADEAPAHRDAPVVDVPSSPRSFRDARARALADFERKFLTELLSEHHGNITRAARAVGKDRRALGRLVKKHQLDRTGP